MLSRIHSFGVRGVDGYPVLVELDLANGLPGYATVGLPDSAVRESRERVTSAVRNSGFKFPNRRIVVNLAPAQSRKEGTHYDLPIAMAVLSASGQLPEGDWAKRYCFIGELALDGALRPVPGVLAMALEAKAKGFCGIVVPSENRAEAQAIGLPAFGAASLCEVVDAMSRPAAEGLPPQAGVCAPRHKKARAGEDFSDVRGQLVAKQALEVAAAGGHHVLLIGPPGVGKSMLAKRLTTLLPDMTEGEALQVSRVHSVWRRSGGLVDVRPFRSPHHTASHISLIGGGPAARPGEAALAHGGVLFLDEVAEFGRQALEALRQPLEDCRVVIARARDSVEFPARFMLVAATNPCPCGWHGAKVRECRCTPPAVQKYLSRLSGPLLDRIDIQIELNPVPFSDWAVQGSAQTKSETSAEVRARVSAARAIQRRRFRSSDFAVNAYIPGSALRAHCAMGAEAMEYLAFAAERKALSARGLDRLLRVARTVADLAGAPAVGADHLKTALGYRSLERLQNAVQGQEDA